MDASQNIEKNEIDILKNEILIPLWNYLNDKPFDMIIQRLSDPSLKEKIESTIGVLNDESLELLELPAQAYEFFHEYIYIINGVSPIPH